MVQPMRIQKLARGRDRGGRKLRRGLRMGGMAEDAGADVEALRFGGLGAGEDECCRAIRDRSMNWPP